MRNEKTIKIFGYHASFDLGGCNDRISSEQDLKEYAFELCKVIKMKPYGEPLIPYFGHKSKTTKGYSLLQFVETSSITGHFSEHYKSAHIDIFSCKKFDADVAMLFTKKFFDSDTILGMNQMVRCCK